MSSLSSSTAHQCHSLILQHTALTPVLGLHVPSLHRNESSTRAKAVDQSVLRALFCGAEPVGQEMISLVEASAGIWSILCACVGVCGGAVPITTASVPRLLRGEELKSMLRLSSKRLIPFRSAWPSGSASLFPSSSHSLRTGQLVRQVRVRVRVRWCVCVCAVVRVRVRWCVCVCCRT